MASDKEAKDGMPPFISDSRRHSALSLIPPCRASHVSFCQVVSDFPNGLQFFLEQGRAHLDFSSSNPHNSRCESPAGLPGTMSGKEPDKILLLGVLFCRSHAAHGLVLWEADHVQAHAEEQVQPRSAGELRPPCPPHRLPA